MEQIHLIIDIVTPVFLLLAAWVGLLIKNSLANVTTEQMRVKEELVASQTEMKEDLTAKHAENRQDLAAHTARDEEQFKNLNKTLDRIELMINKVANGR